jgi:hypothetical protein
MDVTNELGSVFEDIDHFKNLASRDQKEELFIKFLLDYFRTNSGADGDFYLNMFERLKFGRNMNALDSLFHAKIRVLPRFQAKRSDGEWFGAVDTGTGMWEPRVMFYDTKRSSFARDNLLMKGLIELSVDKNHDLFGAVAHVSDKKFVIATNKMPRWVRYPETISKEDKGGGNFVSVVVNSPDLSDQGIPSLAVIQSVELFLRDYL